MVKPAAADRFRNCLRSIANPLPFVTPARQSLPRTFDESKIRAMIVSADAGAGIL
jgi:hypothetical protein